MKTAAPAFFPSWRSLGWPALCLALAGCVSGPVARPPLAVYDLGDTTAPVAAEPVPAGIAAVDVKAPSWLDGRAMQYRLAEEPARRQVYTESRWAAPPAELLAVALRRQLGAGGEGCRLRLDLDEWVQVFDGPDRSRFRLALRAGLQTPRGTVLAHREFRLEQQAGADARHGVAAAAALEPALAADLADWLRVLDRERSLPKRCKD